MPKRKNPLVITLEDDDGTYNIGDHVRGSVTINEPSLTKWYTQVGLTHQPDIVSGEGSQASFDFILNNKTGYQLLRVTAYRLDPLLAMHSLPAMRYYEARILIRVLPAGKESPRWSAEAWDALKVNGFVPGDPITMNRRITQLYAAMYNSDEPEALGPGSTPSKFEWAGMAAFASYQAGDAMALAKSLTNWNADPLFSALGFPESTGVLNGLWSGNLAIFMDMYPQMLAYREGGLAEIDAMQEHGEIKFQDQVDAWASIDEGVRMNNAGKVWEGVLLQLRVEQGKTLQAILDRDPELWRKATQAQDLTSPIPGDDSTFQQYCEIDPFVPDDLSFGDGRTFGDPNGGPFARGTARYLWFKNRMVPAWKDGGDSWRKLNGLIDVNKLLNGGYKE